MPKFQITTTSGVDYVDGTTRYFEFFDTTETLMGFVHAGDYVELQYSGDIKIAIPDAQIAHVITA